MRQVLSKSTLQKTKLFIIAACFAITPLSFIGVAHASPDELIVVRDSNEAKVYLYLPNGQLYSTVNNGEINPQISPDGTKLIYGRSFFDQNFQQHDELYTSNLDGSNEQALTNTPDFNEFLPFWSPDGTRILFSGGGENDPTGLYIMNSDGTNREFVLADVNGEKIGWSPDGSRIAFTTSYQSYPTIGFVNTDGSNLVVLDSQEESWEKPAWSPDGTKIAYLKTINTNGDPVYTVRVSDVDGTDAVDLYSSPSPNPNDVSFNDYFSWSPDSNKIILPISSSSSSLNGIFTVDVNTGSVTEIIQEYNDPVLQWWKLAGGNSQPQTLSLSPSADAYVKSGNANHNQGAETYMNLQASGSNRGLVRFDQSSIASTVGSGTVTSAKLRLTITDNGNNWGATGRTIDLHRLISDWAEGNGTDNDRGTGSGATWSCAIDSLIQNTAKDCSGSTEWEMGQPNNPLVHPWIATASATQTITNNQTGIVEFDVTADVAAFANGSSNNYGWIIKKTAEGQNGQVSFGTKEGSGVAAELVITYQP